MEYVGSGLGGEYIDATDDSVGGNRDYRVYRNSGMDCTDA